jgi:dihydroorotate dehydrogenase (NAD+) catalytic subunit
MLLEEMDFSVDLCGVKLENPLVLASGVLGTSADLLARMANEGAGAVTCKSVCLEPREGHKNPICLDWGKGIINAVGLPGVGAEKGSEMIIQAAEKIDFLKLKTPIIASIFAGTADDFVKTAIKILQGNPKILELNISCPNVHSEFGESFTSSPKAAASVVEAVREVCKIPLFVKLGPMVPSIVTIAKAVVDAGADGITAINTVPGMVIDLDSGKPLLSNKIGGVSGYAIKPVAVRAVYEIKKAMPDIPVIGTGGITNGLDAAEILLAGADAVGISAALYYKGVAAFNDIQKELAGFMMNKGYKNLSQFRGLALKNA